MKTLIYFFILFGTNIISSQNTVEVEHENAEGVIFCRSYFSDGHLEFYDVFDATPQQVEIFENKLREIGKPYKNFVRQYYGVEKEGRKLLVASLILNKMISSYPNWKKKQIIIIDVCEGMRSIVFDLSTQEILWDKNGGGCP